MLLSASNFMREKRKQSNQWSVTREKVKMGSKQKVPTHSPEKFFEQETWETLSVIDDQCIKLLQFMLPVGNNKNYCRSYEFHQIICPLNKHSQNRQNFGKNFKIKAFEVDINNNSISLIFMLQLTKFHGIKGNNSFQLQHFSTDTWYSAVNQSNINRKALLRRFENIQTLRLFSIWTG